MKKMLFWSALLLIGFSSCSKDPLNNLSEEESRIYITNYDTTVAFSAYKTFSIADSVALINNGSLQHREQSDYDAQFINAVATMLEQRGYTRVPKNQHPDLGITVSIINNTATGIVQYSGYGNYYSDYWDPYFWGYPGYSYYFPEYYGTYQVNETALSVDMLDLKNSHQNSQLKAVWSGLIRGEGIFRTENINTQVQSLFSQSPYLKSL